LNEQGEHNMKVIFLGTNGWYDSETGNTICTLIRTKKYDIILDAGNGFHKADRHMKGKRQKPVYLFLSHFHLDHVTGLHILNKFKFSHGLTICGPSGAKNILKTIINIPFSAPLNQLPFPVTIRELPKAQKMLPFRVEARPLFHTTLTLGYRIETDDRVIAYCPDTGYCKNAVKLARAADLLIAECAYKSGQTCDGWPHLNPETAALIAKEASVKQLALVHFDAEIYKTFADRKNAAGAAKKIFKNTFAATDNMHIEI